jgi:RNA polymerase sigma-70 factor (ECF subfamily)
MHAGAHGHWEPERHLLALHEPARSSQPDPREVSCNMRKQTAVAVDHHRSALPEAKAAPRAGLVDNLVRLHEPLARLPQRHEGCPASEPAQRQLLAEAWSRAQQTWPGVALGVEHFRQHCESVLGSAPSWNWSTHGSELYLCCACAANDGAATSILMAQYLRVIERQLAVSRRHREVIEDAMQMLRIKLLVGPRARIGSYAGRGPLLGWLRVAAKRMLLDLLRARRFQQAEARSLAEGSVSREPEFVSAISRGRYRAPFLDGLRYSFGALDTEDRLLMKRAYLEGKTIDELGGACSVHRSTAARRLQRIRQQIAASLRQQLATKYALSAAEFEDVARDLCADLQLDLQVLLTVGESVPGQPDGAQAPPQSTEAQPHGESAAFDPALPETLP